MLTLLVEHPQQAASSSRCNLDGAVNVGNREAQSNRKMALRRPWSGDAAQSGHRHRILSQSIAPTTSSLASPRPAGRVAPGRLFQPTSQVSQHPLNNHSSKPIDTTISYLSTDVRWRDACASFCTMGYWLLELWRAFLASYAQTKLPIAVT